MLVVSKEHQPRRVEKPFQQYLELKKKGALEPRDTDICVNLAKFRFMTQTQLMKLYFPSLRRCQQRLKYLYDYGILDRFRTATEKGKGEYIYCLDQIGTYLVAGYYNYPLSELKWRKRENTVNLFYLEHFLEVVEAYMIVRNFDLKVFETEYEFDPGKADAYIEIVHNGYRYYFFLEVDRATEREDKIAKKVKQYEKYYKRESFMPWVMFVVPTKDRQKQLIKWIEKHHTMKKIRFIVSVDLEATLRRVLNG